jgi:hypothetical protein
LYKAITKKINTTLVLPYTPHHPRYYSNKHILCMASEPVQNMTLITEIGQFSGATVCWN